MNDENLEQLENDITTQNPYKIYEKYYTIFSSNKKNLPMKKIKVNDEFFRARAGKMNEKGAIDDCDIDIQIPYFRDSIGAAPIIYTPGGRFNREGNSFLYLASDINTCVSEMKLEKQQVCSIGKFKCIKDCDYFDLTNKNENNFFNVVKNIMLQPIHTGIRYKYLITQFIADIIRDLGFYGIIYDSTQGSGENLVCFNKEDFEFIDYSDQMYQITDIKYTVQKIDDGYKEYINYSSELNSYNEKEEEKKEKIFDYINKKISNEQENELKKN